MTLWEVPAATIRRPDVALHDCAPGDLRPLPASYVRVVIEVVSPGSDKTDRVVIEVPVRFKVAWNQPSTLAR